MHNASMSEINLEFVDYINCWSSKSANKGVFHCLHNSTLLFALNLLQEVKTRHNQMLEPHTSFSHLVFTTKRSKFSNTPTQKCNKRCNMFTYNCRMHTHT